MNRTPIHPDLALFPADFRPLMEGVPLYDSSCSPAAEVVYIHRDGGYFLKSAPAGDLQKEAMLTRFFHEKGLAAEVLCYHCEPLESSRPRDWLLTRRVPGEDCTHSDCLADPRRLCDTTAELLRALHEISPVGCPIPNRTADYLATARHNYQSGVYDTSLFPDNWGYACAEDAIAVLEREGNRLKSDVLLHGDYCLPNVILDQWHFSGFIDLGSGGVGDRHIDLFWGVWSLFFNLKTDRYGERFLDAYGRDKIEPDLLRVIAAAEVFQ